MNNSTPNVNDLFGQAAQSGSITKDSLHALVDVGAEIEAAMGTSAEDVQSSEVFLLSQLVDDTGSIRTVKGNTKAVRDGHNLVLDELEKSNKGDDIMAHTRFLNSGVLFGFCPVQSGIRLDMSNYNPGGGTPLYDQSLIILGSVLAKEQEFANQGVPVRTVTVIISDGGDNESRHPAADVAKVVRDMLRTENHIVAFMGIDDGSTDFRQIALDMGIPDDWILTPKNDGHSIRQAFGLISRASKMASQGADSFSNTKATGFGAGITS